MLIHPSPFSSPSPLLPQGWCGTSRPPRLWPTVHLLRMSCKPAERGATGGASVPDLPHVCSEPLSLSLSPFPFWASTCPDTHTAVTCSQQWTGRAKPDVSYRWGERRRNKYPTGVWLQSKPTLPEHMHLLPAPQPMRMLKIQISNIWNINIYQLHTFLKVAYFLHDWSCHMVTLACTVTIWLSFNFIKSILTGGSIFPFPPLLLLLPKTVWFLLKWTQFLVLCEKVVCIFCLGNSSLI